MIRQQFQCSLGVLSLIGIETYRANRKPNSASERAICFPSLNLVNPVRSDSLALNKDRVVHLGAVLLRE